jgi:hypothetical protein
MPQSTEYAYDGKLGANTPSTGNPISTADIKRVFGDGLGLTPGTDLNDYHGISYWETSYPFRQGKFNATLETQLTLQDFYGKSSGDPVIPGFTQDFDPGGPRIIPVPPFRRRLRIEIWGAGGGGGAGDHDTTPATAAAGGTSTVTYRDQNDTAYTITSNGGGGGGGGYRYGNQNGGGGGGGTASNTAGAVGVITKVNGGSGAGGNAGDGRGGNAGSANNGSFSVKTDGVLYGVGGAGGRVRDGFPGTPPGGGGGGGGSSDFQTGKNANPNRAAGGGGGAGAYAKVELTRNQVRTGSNISYTIGTGGNGASGNLGKGAKGASGGFRLSYDYDPAAIAEQRILLSKWDNSFDGAQGTGWNDLVMVISTSQINYAGIVTKNERTDKPNQSGGIILSVTGVSVEGKMVGNMQTNGYKTPAPGAAPFPVYSALLMYEKDPLFKDKDQLKPRKESSGWKTMFNNGSAKLEFKVDSEFDGTVLIVKVYGKTKTKFGGSGNDVLIAEIKPTISYP